MKNLIFGLFAICLSLEVSASVIANNFGLNAPASTITFDEFIFPQNTVIDNQYSTLGVTFTSGLRYDTLGPGTLPGIDGHYLGNFSPLINPFSIFFNSNQTEAAFGFASNPQITTLTALLDGNIIESISGVTSFDNPLRGFYGFENIIFDEIQIAGSEALIDNIQFDNVSSVPVPAAVWLFGFGLMGLIGMRRKSSTVATLPA